MEALVCAFLEFCTEASMEETEQSLAAITASKKRAVVSDSFLRYWYILEAIIPVKVEFVEAGLAFGLPRAADHDRHGYSQASALGPVTIPKGNTLILRSRQDIRLRRGHPLRCDDAICHSRKLLSIMLTRTHKFVASIL